jgi:hypothetical protein
MLAVTPEAYIAQYATEYEAAGIGLDRTPRKKRKKVG